MRVLVIEDEPRTAEYLQKGLTESGFVVDIADNGSDGIHMAEETEYDAIILDVMLPGTDGWTVIKSIRSKSETPVLFLTALDDVADRVRGFELGRMIISSSHSPLLSCSRASGAASGKAHLRSPSGYASRIWTSTSLVVGSSEVRSGSS